MRWPFVSRKKYDAYARDFKVVEEVFGRTIHALKAVSFDATQPLPSGHVKWAQVATETGDVQMSVWFESPESERSTDESVHEEGLESSSSPERDAVAVEQG